MSENLELLLKQQGESFTVVKDTLKEVEAEVKKLGSADALLIERLTKAEGALDKAAEGKIAIDAKFAAEKAEREALEIKLNRMGLKNDAVGKAEMELKEFNTILNANSIDRRRPFTPLDEKGYGDYKSAFDRFAREGHQALSPDEVKTLSVGSDPDGGYFVTPDVTGGIVKKVYETSPVRQYASARTISTDALEGIEDLGEAGVGYAGEHSTSGDTTTPQVGEWKIPVFNLDTEPKATQNLLDDASVNIEGWLMDKVGGKFGRFENSEFVTGAANKIRGFINGYPVAADSGSGVAWGSIGYLATGVSADFAASAKGDKLIDLMGLLKNEYLINAAWFTRRSVITAIRKFKDGQSNYLWQPSFVAGVPETIMGYPVVRMEDMPALGADSLSLAFGDLKQAYQIVDRQGIRVLRDNLTSKPYTKFYTTKRTGGGVVNFEALKILKFGTS